MIGYSEDICPVGKVVLKMYEFLEIRGSTCCIQSPARIGLVRLNEKEVCLIDSGSDKDAGRKVRQILDARGWHLRTIYNTHSHADHIGGNHYLQAQTGCEIYAPAIECGFTRNPILEPALLYGGNPPKELRHKFLMAQESRALPLAKDALPDGWELIPLPGHCMNMVGFRTPDNAVFLADCLSSRETLEKYRIGYLWDVGAYLDTLKSVMTLQAEIFVPAHADITTDITGLARYNIDCVTETGEHIHEICREPITFEQLLRRLFLDYGLTMNFEQHALIGSTVRSYLTWLKESGRMEAGFEDGLLLWHSL